MAGSRTLKLSILGDVDNLNKSLKTATADVETFGDKIGKAGKMIGAAFVAATAAAGAYAVKIGIDGVKAALEDEKAQRILALTLENTTGATNKQIAAVEEYITEVSLATGVTDDQLRPALSRLVRSTKDTEEAQKLLSLALDISSATGKPLEAIANSLGKAYDGNTNALGKLGLGIDQSILKTKDFNKVYENLRGSFAGFAAQEANTFQGRLDRLNVAFDEAKETIGFALLPVLEKLITFINTNALPIINLLSNSFSLTGNNGLGKTISNLGTLIKDTATPIFEAFKVVFDRIRNVIVENKDNFESFFEVVKRVAPLIGSTIGGAIKFLAPIAETVLNLFSKILGAIAPLLNTAIDGINTVIRGLNLVKIGSDIPYISKIGATGITTGFSGTTPGGQSFSGNLSGDEVVTKETIDLSSNPANIAKYSTNAAERAAAQKIVDAMTFNIGGLNDAANTARTASGSLGGVSGLGTSGAFDNNAGMGTTINLTVNGAVDSEGTARTIIDTLNNSYYRGTGGATNLTIT